MCRGAGALTAAPVAPDEVEDSLQYQREVDDERLALQPLSTALRDQAIVLARAVGDQDVQVRISARLTLEMLADARIRLLRRASSAVAAPHTEGVAEGGTRSGRYLLDDPLLAPLHQACRR